MSGMPQEIWHVTGDPLELHLKHKIDAETRARELFPTESVERRYDRIYFTHREAVYTYADGMLKEVP